MPCGTMTLRVEVGALVRAVVEIGDAHVGPVDVTGLRIHDDAMGRWQFVTMVLRSEPSGFIEWMRSPLSSRRNSRPDRVTVGTFVPAGVAVEVFDVI